MILFVAAILILAVVYSVFSATTIADNINTGGTLTVTGVSTLNGAAYASSTLQSTGGVIAYGSLVVGRATSSSGTALAVPNGESLLGGAVTAWGEVKAPFFSATSSTASVFPVASTTSFSVADRITVAGDGFSVIAGSLGVATGTPGTALGVTGAGVFTGRVMAPIFSATSTTDRSVFPIASTTSFSIANVLDVDGAGTSTFDGALTVTAHGVFSNRLGVNASTSPWQELGVTGDAAFSSGATTTISAASTAASTSGCIELKGMDNGGATFWVRIYAGGAASSSSDGTALSHTIFAGGSPLLVVQKGRCQ